MYDNFEIFNEARRPHCGPKRFKAGHSTNTAFGKKTFVNGVESSYNPNNRYFKKSPFAGIKNRNTKNISRLKQQLNRSKISNNNSNGNIGFNNTFMENTDFDNEKPIQLLDYKMETYESYYNSYYKGSNNITKSNKVKIKGIKFINEFNKDIANVEVEMINERNIITKFEVNPECEGMGFAKDLLKIAKTNLSANEAKIERDNESKINFFLSNGFIIKNYEKQYCILKLNMDSVKLGKSPINVSQLNGMVNQNIFDDDKLYNLGGHDYEGYRNYI